MTCTGPRRATGCGIPPLPASTGLITPLTPPEISAACPTCRSPPARTSSTGRTCATSIRAFADNGYFSWAPEWFIDQDGTVYLYLSRQLDDYEWRIYWTKPTSADLTSWAPVQRLGGDMADRGGIDPSVVRDGDVYYLAYRNYGAGGGTDCIEIATGSSPTSFSLYKTGDWAGWGSPREAPSLVHSGRRELADLLLAGGQYARRFDHRPARFPRQHGDLDRRRRDRACRATGPVSC